MNSSWQSSTFSRLIAEHEKDWLADVFVPPADFDAMLGMRSILVYGRRGEGKTALRLMLAQRAHTLATQSGQMPPLIVDWRPTILPVDAKGSIATQKLLKEAARVTAHALLPFLAQHVDRLAQQANWITKLTGGFVHRHLGPRLEIDLGRMEERYSLDILQGVREFLGDEMNAELFTSDNIETDITDALKHLGIGGIWLMVDGLEPWADSDAEQLGQAIKDLFSTLGLFEVSDVAIKLMAPEDIKRTILNSGALTRRRLDPFELRWSNDKLVEIVEKRLAFARQWPDLQLNDVCPPENQRALMTNLEQTGAGLPRAWLEAFKPFAVVEEKGKRGGAEHSDIEKPLDIKLAPIRVNRESGEIFVGHTNKTNQLQDMERRILLYLFEQYPRLCTREEIYYRVYMGLAQVPRNSSDGHWTMRSIWDGTIDTIVYRIRQVIEPDPHTPCYLVTIRRKGLSLQNVA